MKDTSKETVDNIIKLLCDRGGFDDWWYNIDSSTQDEIKKEIQDEIKSKN